MTTQFVKVTLFDKTYDLPFPNVGQHLEIQFRKHSLANQNYNTLLESRLKADYYTLDLVDSISVLSTLIPSLTDELKIDDISKMDLKSCNAFIRAYKKDYFPWYNKIQKEIFKDLETTEDE